MTPDVQLVAMLLTPSVVVGVVGYLLKRAINGTDAAVQGLQNEVKGFGAALHARDLDAARSEARLEARIEALERELFNPKKGA